jgi:alpha-N-acetylglucosaminidase
MYNDIVRSKNNPYICISRLLQAWQFFDNWRPSEVEAFLTAVPRNRILVLDLYAENTPLFRAYRSFYGQPFVWCMLHNFGGVSEMRGNLFHIDEVF